MPSTNKYSNAALLTPLKRTFTRPRTFRVSSECKKIPIKIKKQLKQLRIIEKLQILFDKIVYKY